MTIQIKHGPQFEDAIYQAAIPDGNGASHPLLRMGRYAYGQEFFVHWEGENCQIDIGRYSSIAQNVRFFAGQEHHTEWATTYPFTHSPLEWEALRSLTGHPMTRGNIIVGNDVWIGYGALIRSGVTIHHGAVVGMGAVVTRDVPPYTIVAGNPAQVVRCRFDAEIITRLLALAWWDWPVDIVREIAPLLAQPLTIETLEKIAQRKP